MLVFLVHQDPLDRELEEVDYEQRVQGIKSTTLSEVSYLYIPTFYCSY